MGVVSNSKKILILGGTSASLDIVKQAKILDLHVTITDDQSPDIGVAKPFADAIAQISTTDYESLTKFISEQNIDGIFCGPSEFNIQNCIIVAELTNLPFYCSQEQWNICANKEKFKKLCRAHDIPTVPEYFVREDKLAEDLAELGYPLVIKPVDASSSRGLTVCHNKTEAIKAFGLAKRESLSKKVIVEKFIENDGVVFSFRYILNDGRYYPYLLFDTYVVDPIEKKFLISAFTYLPSAFAGQFLQELDQKVQKMFSSIDMKNGTAFIQALPHQGKIYCNEMGYRLSGGLTYKLSEPLMGINDIQMMLRYAMDRKMATEGELSRIILQPDIVMGQLMIPLNCGTIRSVRGLEEILKHADVLDFLQYYREGDVITPQVMGTLEQHFGRFTLRAKNKEEMVSLVNFIQEKLQISNARGEDMYSMKFDVTRLY